MGVGWGYGANMLTKYLAEVGEKTPLTAATCIDNPFDLEEASRVSPNHFAVDQKLTGGLIEILRSNKVHDWFKFFICLMEYFSFHESKIVTQKKHNSLPVMLQTLETSFHYLSSSLL